MSKKLTMGEMTDLIASETTLSKDDIKTCLSALATVTGTALAAGNTVPLAGIGTFKPVERAERQGRNPSTGEPITIKASTGVGFSAAKSLKDTLNG